MIQPARPIRIAALYKFAPFEDCDAAQHALAAICCSNGIKGTLLIAHEGINGTIAGSDAGIEIVLNHIRALPGCADLDVKTSWADTLPFHRMKVRIKREIVTMGQPDIDPLADAGHYVAPEEWNALIADPATILIDTRNDYEVAIGTFAGAIDPRTKTFRDFPDWFREHRAALIGDGAPPKVAMFCTGGIRCEKATAFLKAEGLDAVYHLKGGILNYLETVAPEESLWRGECFVFDQRAAVTHNLAPGSTALCHACRRPIGDADRLSPLYAEGVSCPACHHERTDEQRAGYAERHRQTRLAARRGGSHIGPMPARA
ncbi:oxygen-dependent tRNA uridine(34) hydroxylase TrhO [Sphingomonas nostoxanthinifaciens]|uniref:oxygen-dependent tRNA uridine(34) hydroxylase TrhO n=1 Tax=Sphingomonas nostoxanthinifaciens TaxID=2872652 RepID=UPI001CC1E2E0|nr:rhodanese-related sulfurtransferase [Sphingomonas nostoxanthinifaciens]